MAAGAVVASPAIAGSTFSAIVPKELRKGLADGTTTMRVSLVETVNGRRVPCNDHGSKILILTGNFDSPGKGDALISDPVSWDVEREMTIEGLRVFGGMVGGRPYQNFAWFAVAPKLMPGNVLTVNYTLTFGMDIMSEEHRDRPLRELMDEDRKRLSL